MKHFVFIAFIFLLNQAVYAEKPITIKNWIKHPFIVGIRDNYETTKRDNNLIISTCSSKIGATWASLTKDPKGVVRFLDLSYDGGGGMGGHKEYFYDSQGKLLFYFHRQEVMGEAEETRRYFDTERKIRWAVGRACDENDNCGKFGEDEFFYTDIQEIVFNPKQHYDDLCQ